MPEQIDRHRLKRYLPFILVIVLAVMVLFVIHTKRDKSMREGIDDFIPPDIQVIDKIIISDRDHQVLLEKSGNDWTINQSGRAGKERVMFLLSGIQRLEMISPVSRTVRQEIMHTMTYKGRLVELYRKNRLSRSFYVYFDSITIHGTCMMKHPSGTPLEVKLKGFPVKNLMELFSADEHSYYESALFGHAPGEILEIAVEYMDEPDKSYKITWDENGTLMLVDPRNPDAPVEADHQEISDYLNFFGKIDLEPVNQSLSEFFASQQPFAEITVRVKSGPGTRFKAYRYQRPTGKNGDYDKNLYIAILAHNHDTVVIHYSDTDPIFRQIGDFQKK